MVWYRKPSKKYRSIISRSSLQSTCELNCTFCSVIVIYTINQPRTYSCYFDNCFHKFLLAMLAVCTENLRYCIYSGSDCGIVWNALPCQFLAKLHNSTISTSLLSHAYDCVFLWQTLCTLYKFITDNGWSQNPRNQSISWQNPLPKFLTFSLYDHNLQNLQKAHIEIN